MLPYSRSKPDTMSTLRSQANHRHTSAQTHFSFISTTHHPFVFLKKNIKTKATLLASSCAKPPGRLSPQWLDMLPAKCVCVATTSSLTPCVHPAPVADRLHDTKQPPSINVYVVIITWLYNDHVQQDCMSKPALLESTEPFLRHSMEK